MVSRRERMVMARPPPRTALGGCDGCASDEPCALLIGLASVFSRESVAQVRIIFAPALNSADVVAFPPTLNQTGPRPSSSATREGNSQQECDHQGAERRFARDIAQDAQWHPRLAAGLDRAVDAIDRPFHGFRNFRNGRFRLPNRVQAFVGVRGQWAFISHDQISKAGNSIRSKRKLLRYGASSASV